MALIKCPECGREISDTCDSCIHCGYKLSKPNFEAKEKINAEKPVDVKINKTEVLVNRDNYIKSVAPLVWGIILGVLAIISALMIFTQNSATFFEYSWLILTFTPFSLLSLLCFILFIVNNRNNKKNNKILDPLVITSNGVLIVFDTQGNVYKGVAKGFLRDGRKLYANIHGERVFLGWMSDPHEYERLYNNR